MPHKLDAGMVEIRKQWSSGNRRSARKLCTKLMSEYPDHGDLHQINGLIYNENGQIAEAVKSLENACNTPDPKPVYFTDLAAILGNAGYEQQAKTVLYAAVQRFPVDGKAHLQLGILQTRGMGARSAIPHLKRAIALSPTDWTSWSAMGATLMSLDDIQSAMNHFGKALQYAQNDRNQQAISDIKISIGECHKELGNVDDACALFESVLKIEPANIRAWYCLTLIRKVSETHPAWSAICDIYQSGEYQKMSPSTQEMLLFSIGKVEMQRKNPDAAMKAIHEANFVKRQTITYSQSAIENTLDHVRDCFPKERFAHLEPISNGDENAQHIFIVGMPRSGTTLTEQILSSHPEVFGAGELDAMPHHHHALIEHKVKNGSDRQDVMKYDDDFIRILGQAYRTETIGCIRRIQTANGDHTEAQRIVDKLPSNFTRVGLLALMLPNTRIIHCRRHPMASCFSIYNRRFGGVQNFAYDQRDLGHYYNTYERFMDHWRDVLPADRFIEVDYEDIVENLDVEARRLIAFIGLPWNDACLSFHKTERQIRTHSALEVRKPIYRSSLKGWEPYIDHLGPLRETLGLDKSGEHLNIERRKVS
ncbi:tetratricopeptide repeat-containing sulfotransferase family protein [Thalassospira lucentensis]|uniref:tetratricopeptide repeat-containing sulfotransferase family protein n=1 Tax=Thalassospira lucentensis TaxID=168935 RepID=UPI003D2EB2E7